MTYYTIFPSPIGPLLITSDGQSITRLFMACFSGGPTALAGFAQDTSDARVGLESFGFAQPPAWKQSGDLPILEQAREQLEQYFDGQRVSFDLPLAPEGTAFQRRVWQELTTIPFGKAISYGELARRIGNPPASRAVGLANGKNPISIIVPCHRVIGASGKLTGYGGGLDRKEWLLKHEGIPIGSAQQQLVM
jgi:methylated-DNA-[protein]-cysteine S-methyltransferase